MAVSTGVLVFFNIRKSSLTKYSSNLFQEFTTMSKITRIKKVIEEQFVFGSDFKVIQ